jgi:hypothetical protein
MYLFNKIDWELYKSIISIFYLLKLTKDKK